MSLVTTQHTLQERARVRAMPSTLVQFARRAVKEEAPHCNHILLNTRNPLPTGEVTRTRHSRESGSECIVNFIPLNDLRHINKFLESVNEQLPPKGFFAGVVETAQTREARLRASLPSSIKKPYLFFDYLIKRVWPKLPFFRRLFFFITKGHNRVISEMETYGRLYSCGFRLIESEEINGKLHFVAQKIKEPDYNPEASYGPLIKLRRIGKNGKLVKVYKQRTMSPYSEYVQSLIYEWNGLGDGAKFKDDPRITAVGSFMRKYWLDEIPMLFNLLRGEVKIFGVRPISQHYLSLYPPEFQEFRNQFKPGLIPPLCIEVPSNMEEIVEIEKRYLEAYEKNPLRTDIRYTLKALHSIFIKKVRSH